MKRVRTSDVCRTILAVASVALLTAVAPAGAEARPADRNHDRLPDRWEIRNHLSLRVKQTFRNQDRDELTNHYEFLAGTNPRRSDSDRDGIRDGIEDPDRDGLGNAEEQYLGTHPRKADSDGDGVRDGDADADGDGVSNHDEFVDATDPISTCEGDEDEDRALRFEQALGRKLKFVKRWYPADLGYFDGDYDFDCDLEEDEGSEEGDETDEFDGDEGAGEGEGEDGSIELLHDPHGTEEGH